MCLIPGTLRCSPAAVAGVVLCLTAASASAQTDYYNTDTGRPLTVEDAYPVERHAFEIQLAPLRLERTRGGVYEWEIEPELAYGILPRTQLEIGLPFSYRDAGSGSKASGLEGVTISMLHNLNVETSLPALAIATEVLLPVGSLAPEDPLASAKAVATRTFGWARFHLNGSVAFGPKDVGSGSGGHAVLGESSRWMAGLAVDRTYPLRSMLIGAEVFARRSRSSDSETEWNAAAGVRRQLSPNFNVDAGIGKQLNGEDRSWFATFGLSHAFAVRSLFSGAGRK